MSQLPHSWHLLNGLEVNISQRHLHISNQHNSQQLSVHQHRHGQGSFLSHTEEPSYAVYRRVDAAGDDHMCKVSSCHNDSYHVFFPMCMNDMIFEAKMLEETKRTHG